MSTVQPHKFLASDDDLARLINEKANQLYQKLLLFDVRDTEIDDFAKYYFSSHHAGNRMLFSIQSSAHIIYNAVKITNKPIPDTTFIDYGAGLGTLFLLAGMTGFKKVYFNDYFPQWSGYAGIICNKLGITITGFITGDIDAVINYGKKNNVSFDIVASRNVIEHIYDLRSFYTQLYHSGLVSVCYATTSANFHNIATRLQHYFFHKNAEKNSLKKQREHQIKEMVPGIKPKDLARLVKLTRGRAFADFTNAVNIFLAQRAIPEVEFLGTNTCDCKTGVWVEHLITKENYVDIIEKAGFSVAYTAGFWDTHYKYALVNSFTRLLNRIIKIAGKNGYWFAPFVNVVASIKRK